MKYLKVVGALAILAFQPYLTFAVTKPQATQILVESHSKQLDVSANNALLRDVVLAIADKTGLKVKGIDFLKGSVQAHFVNQSLASSLKKLLQNANYLLAEATTAKPGSHSTLTVLSFSSNETLKVTQTKAGDTTSQTEIPASAGYIPEQYRKLFAYAKAGDLQALKKAILNGDLTAQTIATKLLAQKAPGATAELAARMATHTDSNRRINAIQALGELNNNNATEALGAALSDPDFSVRNAAVMGLYNQTSNTAISYLTQALQDEDGSIRFLALDLLAQKGTDGVAGINEAMASNDPKLREHAQELLRQIVPGEQY